MYYQIRETLVPCDKAACLSGETPYAAVLTTAEWPRERDAFTMGIDLDVAAEIDTTKAEVNFDSLTGSFSVPDRREISQAANYEFAFALDEKGIVFIDDSGFVTDRLNAIARNRKWRLPSLERLLYDFLEACVSDDLKLLEEYEKRLDRMEQRVLNGDDNGVMEELYHIRGDLVDLYTHYTQLTDLSQELEENENNFFHTENLRYFHLFTARTERYSDRVVALKEYAAHIRDLYRSQLEARQNKILAVLSIVTTIFFPLSIVTGWYGMNFTHMPELAWKGAYPTLAALCATLILVEIWVFKKNKWL